MSAAFERARAVGVLVLGVSSGPDFGGVRVDAASLDRVIQRLEDVETLLRVIGKRGLYPSEDDWNLIVSAADALRESTP